jgi:hypothetical protein
VADPTPKNRSLIELAERFFEALVDPECARIAWHEFLRLWVENCDGVTQALQTLAAEEDREPLIANLLVPILRNGFRTEESALRLFDSAERMGAHIMPVHFYSPVPNVHRLPESLWDERFDQNSGWSLNEQGQFGLLRTLSAYAQEFGELRESSVYSDKTPADWRRSDSAINASDGALYYSMVRHFRPKQVLEVGSGYSTRIAAEACRRLDPRPGFEAVEPYPPPFLSCIPELSRLSTIPVQQMPLSRFRELEANDILFIDCSHVGSIGSDVTYLLLHVLPELSPGVIVHVHDIFLPWNYPKDWIVKKHLFWNEQYLLLAYLHQNRSMEVLLGSYFLGRLHPEEFRAAFPYLDVPGGSSFWMRRLP